MEKSEQKPITKAELEREKLRLEIAELNRPWWKKPTYILAALPTLLAIVSVGYALASGYFQAVAVQLENRKTRLEMDIQTFTAEKDQLILHNAQLMEQNKRLANDVKTLQEKRTALGTLIDAFLLSNPEAMKKTQPSNNRPAGQN